MAILKQYNTEQLETWRPGRVCCLFMNAFEIKLTHPDSRDLENLSQQLSTIDFKKRLEVRGVLQQEMQKSIRTESYTNAARFRDMLRYYEQHVMG